MPVSRDEFRQALSRFASGVTVVTAYGEDGRPRGLTVSAFCSLSLDPPLVLICIDKKSSLHPHLSEGRRFAVSILAEDQEAISRRFAYKDLQDRFNGIKITGGATGLPLIEGAIAHIECLIVGSFPGGDHTIFIGQVEATAVKEGNPLAYFRGKYARLESPAD